ncbi:thioredoxin-dependent thiol peroxidase [Ruania albidiflava]|uniref:thioredoxin-dependent thiol peroxidase n=1 Tax=Ruania albidiflava TaxID=366586 RepID=UPI0023F4C34E|nr:thioredoxin-dependent thiol peroxidase [Ruania albidiflava]
MPQLTAGTTAPDFTLTAHTGEQVSLASVLSAANQGVIVYFYPKAATPGCTTEACDFRDNLASLGAAGYHVIGISPDPINDLQAFAQAESLTFPLAADTDHAVAEAYGVWGPRTINGRTFDGVRRSTFVVRPDGTLRSAEYDVDATGHVARLRTELLGS